MHGFENKGILVCPLCQSTLDFCGNSLACGGERRHNFDIAKSGYVNLNTHASASGDDKAMAKARQTFLRRGYYEKLADTVAPEELVQPLNTCPETVAALRVTCSPFA